MSDRVRLLDGKTRSLDVRYQTRGDKGSGIANIRMKVSLEVPTFDMHVGGKELAARVARMYRENLSSKFSRGLDSQGRPLQPIKPQTQQRRIRRQRQREDGASRGGHAERQRAQQAGNVSIAQLQRIEAGENSSAKKERLSLKGRGQTGRTEYAVIDVTTPFHESGLASDNVFVTHKGSQSCEPVFLIGLPTGGSVRGHDIDDGRGARLFAAEHYGFLSETSDAFSIPDDLDQEVIPLLDQHLDAVVAGIGSIRDLAESFGELIDEVQDVTTGELDE